MEDRAPHVSSSVSEQSITQQSITQQSVSQQSMLRRREGRGAWVMTAYCISGLALFGLLAYFFSEYIAH
jgi:hypothetical protein